MVQVGGAAAAASLCCTSASLPLGCREVVFLSFQLGTSCVCCLGDNSGTYLVIEPCFGLYLVSCGSCVSNSLAIYIFMFLLVNCI